MDQNLSKIKEFKKLNKLDQTKWYEIVKPIIETDEFLVRINFLHHEAESLYEHLIKVSIKSYLLASKYKVNVYNCTIAGLLHDFYEEAWQNSDLLKKIDDKYSNNLRNNIKYPLFKKHGFTHGINSSLNAQKYYLEFVNERIIDAISKHMFPLSLFTKTKIPKYKESWLVTIVDKKVSFSNFPKLKNIPKYLGIKR